MSTDLVFAAAPATGQPVNLVFNESDAPSLDRQLTAAGTLPLLVGAAVAAVEARVLDGQGTFLELRGSADSSYNSDTQRPVVGTVIDTFQNGLDVETGIEHDMQDGLRMRVTNEGQYQDAIKAQQGFEDVWQNAMHLRRVLEGSYQQGLPVRNGFDDGYVDATRARRGVEDRYQQGVKVRNGFTNRFQDGTKGRRSIAEQYQDASPYNSGWLTSRVQRAIRTSQAWDDRYQDAIRPPGGLWFRPPVVPTDPCYIPDPNLVFVAPWSADTNLVFVCETHGTTPPEPGGTIVVPVKRVYVVLNSATLRRVDGDVPLPTFSMSLSLDADSWTWTFSAALPGRALADVEPDSDGNPVEVEALINGVAYRFIVEKVGRERAFASDGLRINGRGLSARLDAPYAPSMSFGNETLRTAQQLMGDVLTENGVPMGWDIDWQIEDWEVPGGNWRVQGSYIQALNQIVGAAGGYLQPTPSGMNLKALLRYPTLPWSWADVTPDIEIPSAVATRESIEWAEKARYNRVFVSGQGPDGRVGRVTRAGTSGGRVAPDVVDALLTDPVASRQRGGAILADTGRIANYQLRMPAGVRDTDNNPVGVVPPGKFLLYNDNGVSRLGITRSVNVEVQMPDIYQTIGVEAHEPV